MMILCWFFADFPDDFIANGVQKASILGYEIL